MREENTEFPPLYAIRGVSGDADPERAGEEVWVYWSREAGGWYQWGPEDWRRTFETKDEADKIADGWCGRAGGRGVGPWYSKPDRETIEVVPVPNPKTALLRELLAELEALRTPPTSSPSP